MTYQITPSKPVSVTHPKLWPTPHRGLQCINIFYYLRITVRFRVFRPLPFCFWTCFWRRLSAHNTEVPWTTAIQDTAARACRPEIMDIKVLFPREEAVHRTELQKLVVFLSTKKLIRKYRQFTSFFISSKIPFSALLSRSKTIGGAQKKKIGIL